MNTAWRTDAPAAETGLIATVRAGDETAFADLVGRYRGDLEVHCYRMLGSLEDAEDVMQEVLLRAWTKRTSYAGRSTFRAWLYGIATHACLDTLRGRARRVLADREAPAADLGSRPAPPADRPWLQPYPTARLEAIKESAPEPVEAVVARETIELTFLAAIQHLPPRQRAVLLMREVLGWSARETAALVDTSVAAVNSALQRARTTLRSHLPERFDWPATEPSAAERALLSRLMRAWEEADTEGLTALLRADARMTMPPSPTWYDGRDAIATFFARYGFADPSRRSVLVPTGANAQPAAGVYRQARPGGEYLPFAICVLALTDGLIAEVQVFRLPRLFAAFKLAPSFEPPRSRMQGPFFADRRND